MTDTPKTPGEHAYAAYWQRLAQPPATILLTRLAWGEIYPEERAAWEAAAQAVRAQWWRAHEAIICGEHDCGEDTCCCLEPGEEDAHG